jgi:hypothetical protein
LEAQEALVYDNKQAFVYDKTADIMAVPISNSASAAATGYSCNNSILSLI